MNDVDYASQEASMRRQGRNASFVMAGAMLGWLAFSFVGKTMGLPGRYAFLADLACMAALLWSLTIFWRILRWRRTNR